MFDKLKLSDTTVATIDRDYAEKKIEHETSSTICAGGLFVDR